MTRRSAGLGPLATAALWPFGVTLTSWHYMWRTTPLHRRQLAGSPEADSPPELPPGVSLDDVQRPEDGVGDLFHRRYTARIQSRRSPEELMEAVTGDPNRVAPSEFARFIRQKGGGPERPGRAGDTGPMRTDDEYVVRMPGPWNGPVRVVDVTPRSFRLATLRGHLEAGQIEFRVEDDGADLIFTIESWACSGDRLSKVLYQHLRMAKEVQFHMWTSFLENVARLCEGRLVGGIDVETRSFHPGPERPGQSGSPGPERPGQSGSHGPERPGQSGSHGPERRLGDPEAKTVLDALHEKALNFDLDSRADFTPERGWHVDRYCQPLPAESPGPPSAEGTWAVATELMRAYEFADPKIVRAVYYPERPLGERDMLLEARFWGLRFHLGVRVGGVIDDTREVEGREVKVWGWNYRTLQGHLEMGQMDYELWKWLDTGEVEFRISAFSRPAPIANPLVRLGFRLFGRREQVKFARHACARMAQLTAAALDGDSSPTPRRTTDKLRVRSQASV